MFEGLDITIWNRSTQAVAAACQIKRLSSSQVGEPMYNSTPPPAKNQPPKTWFEDLKNQQFQGGALDISFEVHIPTSSWA